MVISEAELSESEESVYSDLSSELDTEPEVCVCDGRGVGGGGGEEEGRGVGVTCSEYGFLYSLRR